MNATTLVEVFLAVVKKHGDKISLMEKVEGEYQGFSYKEFGERVRNFALGLVGMIIAVPVANIISIFVSDYTESIK